MKKLFICIGLLASLAACNTIHGFGQDMEKGGEAIQKAVK